MENKSKPFHYFYLFLTGIILSILAGLLTNMINGLISPLYFKSIMGWQNLTGIYHAIIAQGIFEGIIFGIFLSLFYTISVIFISRWRCTYRLGIGYLLFLFIIAIICWIIGGLLGLGLAGLSPDFFKNTFRSVPDNFNDMLGYAWAGGSIWGIQFGGICTIIIGSLLFKIRWNKAGENE